MHSDPSSPLSLPAQQEYLHRLVRLVNQTYGLRVFIGADPAAFQRAYQQSSETGFAQLPFLSSRVGGPGTGFSWAEFRAGRETVALLAGRGLAPVGGSQRFSELIQAGGLFDLGLSALSCRGWVPNAGPEVFAPGSAIYRGAGWVHPAHRGKTLAGLIVRILNLHLLQAHPHAEWLVGMVAKGLHDSGYALRTDGWHEQQVEPILDGYFPVSGGQEQLYVTSSFVETTLRLYASELVSLRETDTLPWARVPSAALG